MATNSFRQDVDSQLSAVTFTPELRQKILDAAAAGEMPARRKPPLRFKRRAMALVAACLALVFGLAVARLAFPSFDALVNNVGQEVAAFFSPVSLTSDAEGIRMEVVAAVNDGDSAIVYVTLQDLEGDRVDEGTRINHTAFGTYQIPLAAEQVHFDAETRVATFRFELDSMFEPIGGAPLTLEIHSILFGEDEFYTKDIGYTVADIIAMNPAPAYSLVEEPVFDEASPGRLFTASVGYGNMSEAGQRLDALLAENRMPVLAKNSLALPVKGFTGAGISSAGIIDGFLHVRLEPLGDTAYYNRYGLSLQYPGLEADWLNEVGYAHASLMTSATEEGVAVDEEWVFELPHGVQPQDVTIGMSATTYTGMLEGDWSVKFRLEEPETREFETDFVMPGNHVKRVTVSSIGVTMEGDYTGYEEYDMDTVEPDVILVYLRDGRVLDSHDFGWVSGGVAFGDEDSQAIAVDKVSFRSLVPLEDIDKVAINGHEFVLLQK